MSTKVIDLDLFQGCDGIRGLDGYTQAHVLLRWKETPLGRVTLPVTDGRVSGYALARAVGSAVPGAMTKCVLEDMLQPALGSPPQHAPVTASVVVCTRNRPDDLRRCLTSIAPLAERMVELIVVDNDPPDDATAQVCREFPVRRIVEPRRGLNWARSRGISHARGEIVAFIDDDAVASPQWLDSLRQPFVDPSVAAATGLVMPLELENEAQERFEAHCTFVRGFFARRFNAATVAPITAGGAGAGACMAVRRQVAEDLGLFRTEMDCGTITESGGETYAFYRLLALGYTIAYEPSALIWHRHRRDDAALRRVLRGYSIGTYVYLLRCLLHHRETAAIGVGASWLRHHHLREVFAPFLRRHRRQELSLTLAEIAGVFKAPAAYVVSRWREVAPPSVRAIEPATSAIPTEPAP